MDLRTQNAALRLLDDLVAEGRTHFTFREAVEHTGRSASATANLLQRMVDQGLLDRVRRGRYVARQLGLLGTRAAAEDVAVAVAAAFSELPHRIAYRTALDEHDLIAHPSRTIHVATPARMRVKELSGRPLRTVAEPEDAIDVGAIPRGPSRMSDLERALLDAAARLDLAGGVAVLAEALASAAGKTDPGRLTHYAVMLERAAALRRIGSLSDALEIEGLARRLRPLRPAVADLDLEPGRVSPCVWRDARWRVRWNQSRDELLHVIRH